MKRSIKVATGRIHFAFWLDKFVGPVVGRDAKRYDSAIQVVKHVMQPSRRMKSRQLFILGLLLVGGALVSAAFPTHPIFNLPQGKYVLGIMGLSALVSGLALKWRGG